MGALQQPGGVRDMLRIMTNRSVNNHTSGGNGKLSQEEMGCALNLIVRTSLRRNPS
jgi:hypothetical protein